MGLYLEFGSYEPDDEDELPDYLRTPDPEDDLAGFLYERGEQDGPYVCGPGLCTSCGTVGLALAPVWRWSVRHQKRYACWTVSGADCLACGEIGTVREVMPPDETC